MPLEVQYGYNPEQDPAIVAQILLGEESDEWFKGNLGRYALGCANQEISSAISALIECDPEDRVRIRGLQYQIHRALGSIEWLYDLVRAKRSLTVQQDIEMERPVEE